MTAVARGGRDERLLHLLAHSPQLEEWSQSLHRLGTEGRRLAVAHGPNRTPEAERLAHHFGCRSARLADIDRLRRHLSARDLLIVLTPPARQKHSIQLVDGLPALHGLLRDGVVIWGITGPPPDPLAPYCHDVIAVPTLDPLLLLRGHRLVVRHLTRLSSPNSSLAVVGTGERSSASDT